MTGIFYRMMMNEKRIMVCWWRIPRFDFCYAKQ